MVLHMFYLNCSPQAAAGETCLNCQSSNPKQTGCSSAHMTSQRLHQDVAKHVLNRLRVTSCVKISAGLDSACSPKYSKYSKGFTTVFIYRAKKFELTGVHCCFKRSVIL